ncbi:MAG: hypothetical protein IJ740_03515 [Ruminococcus sp.]|nr:hypothetical protein [Ruminococcus sp.]
MKPSNKIIISTETRPCYVMVTTAGKYKAFFHCWTYEHEKFGKYSAIKVYALCEFENGSLKKIDPENIMFADGGNFADTYFIPREELSRRISDNADV